MLEGGCKYLKLQGRVSGPGEGGRCVCVKSGRIRGRVLGGGAGGKGIIKNLEVKHGSRVVGGGSLQ